MANSPIQIVLNTNDFIEAWDRSGGGPNKDFYAGNDEEFVAHRDKIYSELSAIRDMQIENEFSEISYAKLTLKQSALAKSHRPTTAIFSKDSAPVVGAGDLGELYVELQPKYINKITEKIASVETQTRWKEVTINGKAKMIPYPSNLRSELGSIDEIVPYSASDKRKFSVTDGLKWISNPQTGGAYIIELFESPPPRQDWDNLSPQKFKLFKSFTDGLMQFGSGLVASRLVDSDKITAMIGVRLEESDAPANIQLMPIQSQVRRQSAIRKIVQDKTKHAELLAFLDSHPLVKKIILPPIISRSEDEKASVIGEKFEIPKAKEKGAYPKVAVVDGGVSNILDKWVEEKWGLLSPSDKDEDHGTFIGGLLVASNSLNGAEICNEPDGCKIIDLDILPKGDFFANYYNKPLEFFKELEVAVKDLKARTGVRIFNFSLNIEEHVSTDGYSPPAKMLDKIAEDNDVIFVISAGNTKRNDFRKEWPEDASDALSTLASARNDTIKKPAESCRNLSVSALNPPNLKGIVPFAPSNYTCRGPGIRVGLKPDVAHVGGSGTKVKPDGHGLYSIDTAGNIVDGCGTSYAAPHVAKTLANLDHSIEGDVSRETLIALLVHHASLPESLQDKKLKDVAKHLVGFGMPGFSDKIIEGSENSITLVFANRIFPGLKMSFDFTWPPSLIKNGKCCGYAKLSVVSTPPFDYRFGAEFVRVNIEGHLRQQQKDGKFKGRLDPVYLPEKNDSHLYEKDQIAHAFKWSPIKVFERTFKNGVGPSTNWKLDIEYLARDGEDMPKSGVPFTALLTIADPEGNEPVFNDMRQTLQSLGVQILDIKTAARIVPRV
jgi:hypothetical protein